MVSKQRLLCVRVVPFRCVGGLQDGSGGPRQPRNPGCRFGAEPLRSCCGCRASLRTRRERVAADHVDYHIAEDGDVHRGTHIRPSAEDAWIELPVLGVVPGLRWTMACGPTRVSRCRSRATSPCDTVHPDRSGNEYPGDQRNAKRSPAQHARRMSVAYLTAQDHRIGCKDDRPYCFNVRRGCRQCEPLFGASPCPVGGESDVVQSGR